MAYLLGTLYFVVSVGISQKPTEIMCFSSDKVKLNYWIWSTKFALKRTFFPHEQLQYGINIFVHMFVLFVHICHHIYWTDMKDKSLLNAKIVTVYLIEFNHFPEYMWNFEEKLILKIFLMQIIIDDLNKTFRIFGECC